MIDIINISDVLSILYVFFFLYAIRYSRSSDFHYLKEIKHRAIIRRLFFISFFSFLFGALFFSTNNFDTGVMASMLMLTAITGVSVKLLISDNKQNSWNEKNYSILVHIFAIYPVLIYMYYNSENLTTNNLTFTVWLTILFIIFYITIHPLIYEDALF